MYQNQRKKRRRRGKKSYAGKSIISLLLIFITAYGLSRILIIQPSGEPEGLRGAEVTETFRILTEATPSVRIAPPLPLIEEPDVRYEIETSLNLNSANAILLRLDDSRGNEILFDKESSERVYPASLTKIMTAVVIIEHIENFETVVVLSEKMYAYLEKENASVAGFKKNEEVRAIDLLYGVMLPSGAECCIGLAEYISGSEAEFVKLMNKKAAELGMNDTHFVNTTGLHNDNHYSSVSDIAVLLDYAIDNETFYEIFTATSYLSAPTNIHEQGLSFSDTMFWLMERIGHMDSPEFTGGKILGGKTGYTDEAGQCLASLAEKDGERFMLVTCGAPGDYRTQILHIDDAFYVYDLIYYSFIFT